MSAPRLNGAAIGQRVFAFKNLTRGCWSLRALDGASKGRVVAHLDALTLTDCAAKVSAAQAAWMRANRSRLVCGGIVGTLEGFTPALTHGARVTFRPYEGDTFTFADTGETFTTAARMTFDGAGAFTCET